MVIISVSGYQALVSEYRLLIDGLLYLLECCHFLGLLDASQTLFEAKALPNGSSPSGVL